VIERIGDAEGTADLAGMDGQAKAGIAGDIEGAGIIGDAAHAFLAGKVEAGHQRDFAFAA
jgi:hypothetical protein